MALPRFKFLLAAALTAFFATFNNAYNNAVINVPEKVFWQFINETNLKRYGVPMSTQTLSVVWGWIVSIVSVGGFFGSFTTALISERYGRKIALLILMNVIAIVSSLLMASCQWARSYELLAVGRFFNGVGAGLAQTLLPIYLTESCSAQYRGLMGCFHGLFVNFTGILAYVIALPIFLGTESNVPFLLGLGAVPAALQIVSAFFLPESPKYLYIKRRDAVKAEKSLQFWSATSKVIAPMEIQKIFNDFDQEAEALSQEVGFLYAIKIPYFRKVIFLAILVMAGPGLAGASALLSYSTDMFLKLGFATQTSNLCTTLIAVFNTIGALIIFPFVDRFPRRKLLFISYAFLILTLFLYVAFAVLENATHSRWPAYVALISLQLYAFIFPIPCGAVTYVIPTEIVPQAIRSITNSLAVAMSWLSWLLVAFLYPPLEEILGPWCFLVFVVPWILIMIYLYKELPETGQKSVAEIYQTYSGNQVIKE